MKTESLKIALEESKKRAAAFFDYLFVEGKGFRNTVSQVPDHDILFLNGTWACVLGKRLIGGDNWISEEQREQSIKIFKKYRNVDGMIYPKALLEKRTTKPHQYLKLHCNNYATGAMLELDPDYDFASPYLDRFLDPDFLASWLDRVSFHRPWEESNNIVNVASYLALLTEKGIDRAADRVTQMLEWHIKFQNSKTGGFDSTPVSYKYIKQSMAGAVHNFHIHLFLKQSIPYPEVINTHVAHFLVEGPLSACFSIDFVELAVRTAQFERERNTTFSVLTHHVKSLLSYQRPDGGWFESDHLTPTSFEGLREKTQSSSSYSAWFRLCSLGMYSIVFLNDDPGKWHFRKTLGMGYAPEYWPRVSQGVPDDDIIKKFRSRYRMNRLKSALVSKFVSGIKRLT